MIDRAELQAALGVEPADLDLNRQGKMSPRQADEIRSFVSRRRTTVYIALGAAFALGLAGGLAAHAPMPQMIGGAVGGVIFAVVIVTLLNKLLFRPLGDQGEGGVRAVEGAIEKRYVAYSGRGYSVWINGTRYGGTQTKVGKLLNQGDRVRLFVTSGGLVVGAEPL